MTKTLPQKFFVKENQSLLALNAPPEFLPLMSPLPEGAHIKEQGDGPFDQVHIFCITESEMKDLISIARERIKNEGRIWLAYPKGSSKKYKAEINRDSIWKYAKLIAMDAVSLIAINEDWSSMRLKFVD